MHFILALKACWSAVQSCNLRSSLKLIALSSENDQLSYMSIICDYVQQIIEKGDKRDEAIMQEVCEFDWCVIDSPVRVDLGLANHGGRRY